jgi:hypothetical protein
MTDSVMHYEKYAFAKDKTRPTITPIPNENISLGNNVTLSWVSIKWKRLKTRKSNEISFIAGFSETEHTVLFPDRLNLTYIGKVTFNVNYFGSIFFSVFFESRNIFPWKFFLLF